MRMRLSEFSSAVSVKIGRQSNGNLVTLNSEAAGSMMIQCNGKQPAFMCNTCGKGLVN